MPPQAYCLFSSFRDVHDSKHTTASGKYPYLHWAYAAFQSSGAQTALKHVVKLVAGLL